MRPMRSSSTRFLHTFEIVTKRYGTPDAARVARGKAQVAKLVAAHQQTKPSAHEVAEILAKLGDATPLAEECRKLLGECYPDVDSTLRRARSPALFDHLAAMQALNQGLVGQLDAKRQTIEHMAMLTQGATNLPVMLVGPPGVGKATLAARMADIMNRRPVSVFVSGAADYESAVWQTAERVVRALERADAKTALLLLDARDQLDAARVVQGTLRAVHSLSDADSRISPELCAVPVIAISRGVDVHDAADAVAVRVVPVLGYAEQEKLLILRHHLLPRALAQAKLTMRDLCLTEKAARKLVARYPEPGVAGLAQAVGQLVGKTLMQKLAMGEAFGGVKVTEAGLAACLPERVTSAPTLPGVLAPGTCHGVTWQGASPAPFEVQVARTAGGMGALRVTGAPRAATSDATQIALTYINNAAKKLGVTPDDVMSYDYHVHVMRGPEPDSGAGTGLTVAMALVSCLTGQPQRAKTVSIGDVDLRGRVIGVERARARVLAAYQWGARTVVVPRANLHELRNLQGAEQPGLELVPVDDLPQAVLQVLMRLALGGDTQEAMAALLDASGRPTSA